MGGEAGEGRPQQLSRPSSPWECSSCRPAWTSLDLLLQGIILRKRKNSVWHLAAPAPDSGEVPWPALQGCIHLVPLMDFCFRLGNIQFSSWDFLFWKSHLQGAARNKVMGKRDLEVATFICVLFFFFFFSWESFLSSGKGFGLFSVHAWVFLIKYGKCSFNFIW